jgi:acyl-coenzyme A synthetase/AMP-(fatty) acid ligase
MGYYNNHEKTIPAFVQNPLNTKYPEIIYRTGDQVYKNEREEIIFVGRNDTLIKHLGYRIELTEIEHVLINTIKWINNLCVVYNFNKKVIVGFYESDDEISIPDFRKLASTVLPNYMIPKLFHRLESLPRNINGKIDRLYLNQLVNSDGKS